MKRKNYKRNKLAKLRLKNRQLAATRAEKKERIEKPFVFKTPPIRYAKNDVVCEKYVTVKDKHYRKKGYNCVVQKPELDDTINTPADIDLTHMQCNVNEWVDCGSTDGTSGSPCSVHQTEINCNINSHYGDGADYNQCIWCENRNPSCMRMLNYGDEQGNWNQMTCGGGLGPDTFERWMEASEPLCPAGYFYCGPGGAPNGSDCIYAGYACNSNVDCLNGADEQVSDGGIQPDGFCQFADPTPECHGNNTCACLDPEATNFNLNCVDQNGVCHDECFYAPICAANPQVCQDVCCQYPILGCMDGVACNYNPQATQEDGSCYYANNSNISTGGPDLLYLNCDGSCINDSDGDGTCDEFEVYGCTDSTACNYESQATEDNGSCDYSCHGCTDPEACNYKPTATNCPDGSSTSCCDYISCIEDHIHCVTENNIDANTYWSIYNDRQQYCQNKGYFNHDTSACPGEMCPPTSSPSGGGACCALDYADNYDSSCSNHTIQGNSGVNWFDSLDTLYCTYNSYYGTGASYNGPNGNSGWQYLWWENGAPDNFTCQNIRVDGNQSEAFINNHGSSDDWYMSDVEGDGFHCPTTGDMGAWGYNYMEISDFYCDFYCYACGYPGVEVCDRNGDCGTRFAERSGIGFFHVQPGQDRYRGCCNCIETGNPIINMVQGCTDSVANNYNPSAQIDDGSCLYNINVCCVDQVDGCDDPSACNYTGDDYYNNEYCEYPIEVCEDCDQDGIPNINRMCGAVCPSDSPIEACGHVCIPCSLGGVDGDVDDNCPCNQFGCDGVCCGCTGYDPCLETDDCGVCGGNNASVIECWEGSLVCDENECPSQNECAVWMYNEGSYPQNTIDYYLNYNNCKATNLYGNSWSECCGDCNSIAGSVNGDVWCVGEFNNQPVSMAQNMGCKDACTTATCGGNNWQTFPILYWCGDTKYCNNGAESIGFASCKCQDTTCNENSFDVCYYWEEGQPLPNSYDWNYGEPIGKEEAERACGNFSGGSSCIQSWSSVLKCASQNNACGCNTYNSNADQSGYGSWIMDYELINHYTANCNC